MTSNKGEFSMSTIAYNTQMQQIKKRDTIYYIKSALGLLLMFGFGYISPFGGVTLVGMKVVGIFLGLLFLWSTVEIAWPSILGIIAFGTSGFMSFPEVISSGLGHQVIWQFIMIMLIAGAITDSGLGELIAIKTLSRKGFRGKPVLFVWAFLYVFFWISILAGAFAGMFLAWAILEEMAKIVGYKKGDKYITIMMIYSMVSSALGEMVIPFKGYLIALVSAYEHASGVMISYPKYIAIAILVATLAIFLLAISIKFIFKVDFSKIRDFDTTLLGDTSKQKLNYKQVSYFAAFLFIIVSTLMSTLLPAEWAIAGFFKTLTANGVFALPVVLLCLIRIKGEPILDFKTVAKNRVVWEIILICSAILPIASAVTSPETGIVGWCASIFTPLFSGKSTFIALALICALLLICTNLGSNLGVAMLFIPIVVPICHQVGISLEIAGIAIIFVSALGIVLPGASAVSAVAYTNEWLKPKQIMGYASYACLIFCILTIFILYGFTAIGI